MTTERQVVQAVIKGDRAGYLGLFERHGALFREALIRFQGDDGPEQGELLARILREIVEMLRRGEFDDIIETFYNWIVRMIWTMLMEEKLREAGEGHVKPEILWAFTDHTLTADLPETSKREGEEHIKSCTLCRGLLQECLNIPVEVSHAGAAYPTAFQATLDRTLDCLLSPA